MIALIHDLIHNPLIRDLMYRTLIAARLLIVFVAATAACGPAPDATRDTVAEAREQERLLEQARSVAGDESAPRLDRARAHRRLGRSLRRRGRLRDAAARFEAAAELFAEDSAELAPALNALSDMLFRLGEYERQEEVLWRALEQAASTGDRRTAASSWNNLGVSFAARGRPSAALAAYHQCLELRRDLDDRRGVAATRHNLGVQQLLLGRVDEGVEELRRAVAERRRLAGPTAVGQTLASLAWGLTLAAEQDAALAAYAEAVSLLGQAGAVHDLAVALEQRAQLYRALGRFAEARQDLRQSLDLLDSSGGAPPLDAAYLRLGLGAVQRQQDDTGDTGDTGDTELEIARAATVALLRGAVETFDELGAQEGRVLARLELARALRTRKDDRERAIRQLEDALEIVEAARSDLRLPSFRATFLGGWQVVYQELVDILASAAMEAPPPEAGALAASALAVAERARARSLLDRMAAADTALDQPLRPGRPGGEQMEGPAGGGQPWHDLRGELEALEARTLLEPAGGRDCLAGGRDCPAGGRDCLACGRDCLASARVPTRSAGEARAALRRARFALERVQEVSRRAGASSPVARPASVDEIRRRLDADTVLLVYSLAPRRGWLWRVDRRNVTVVALPPGPEIEAAARNAHRLLPLYHRLGYRKAAREALARLARLVLDPVTADLGRAAPGRLAVVPDGALHLVPLGVLPLPSRDTASSDTASSDTPSSDTASSDTASSDTPSRDRAGLLAATYEVLHLPSASTLVELRRRAARPPAPRLLAVVADPVFEADDPRLTGVVAPDDQTPARDRSIPARARRALNGRLRRLPASAEEGSRIAEIARLSSATAPPIYRSFDAGRELVTGGSLGDFRILHFATHGVADAEDPALAGLVLSLYDAAGRPRDGLLRARDLHRLRLSADLVVLSACRTALGQEVRGEGLVGLASGFFAAGANHLVVSLWDVDDRATAELMTRFYRHLLLAGRAPADALRRAQQELRDQTEWRSPAYWAAFVAIGDWRVAFSA